MMGAGVLQSVDRTRPQCNEGAVIDQPRSKLLSLFAPREAEICSKKGWSQKT